MNTKQFVNLMVLLFLWSKKVLQKYINGESGYQLAKKYDIPVSTTKIWKTKVDHPELCSGNERGHPKKSELTKEDYKESFKNNEKI